MIEITVTWLDGNRKGAVETFTSLPLRLGRADECEVRFDADQDLKVSAKHAEVRSDGEGALEVEDLGSKNGTTVNGAATQGPTPLPNHAVVQLASDVAGVRQGVSPPAIRIEIGFDYAAIFVNGKVQMRIAGIARAADLRDLLAG